MAAWLDPARGICKHLLMNRSLILQQSLACTPPVKLLMPFRRHARGDTFKYHFNLRITELVLREGLAIPSGSVFRIAWKRGDKLATTTPTAATAEIRVPCLQTLSIVCTMYRGGLGGASYMPKDSSLTLLQGKPGKPPGACKALGKVALDLAPYAKHEDHQANLTLPLMHDGIPVGDLVCVVSSRWLRHFSRPADSGSTVSLSDVSGSEMSGSESGSTRGGSSGSSGWPTAEEDTDAEISDAASDAGSDRSMMSDRELVRCAPYRLPGRTPGPVETTARDA